MEKLLQRVIGEHIRIVIEPARRDAACCADPSQLEQVILNLGVNARDAMPGGGTAPHRHARARVGADEIARHEHELEPGDYVAARRHRHRLRHGWETRARIFEPFFTTKGPGKGTGLGLATVYGIVKQSGGGIVVDPSRSRSTFSISLPASTDPLDPPAAHVQEEKTDGSETILVVEDEEVVRDLICTVLREAGYHVLCAASPGEALELVRRHRAGSICS